jgi:hypothetical protein
VAPPLRNSEDFFSKYKDGIPGRRPTFFTPKENRFMNIIYQPVTDERIESDLYNRAVAALNRLSEDNAEQFGPGVTLAPRTVDPIV